MADYGTGRAHTAIRSPLRQAKGVVQALELSPSMDHLFAELGELHDGLGVAQHHAKITSSAVQSGIAANTDTVVTLGNNTGAMFSDPAMVATASRIIVQETGPYLMGGQVLAIAPFTASTAVRTRIFINGLGQVPSTDQTANTAPGTSFTSRMVAMANLNAGDYVQLIVWHNSSVTISVGHATDTNFRNCLWVVCLKGAQGPRGIAGPTGLTGSQGPAGTNGQGVPTGGVAGDQLVKVSSTNFDTAWAAPLGEYRAARYNAVNARYELVGADGLPNGTPLPAAGARSYLAYVVRNLATDPPITLGEMDQLIAL